MTHSPSEPSSKLPWREIAHAPEPGTVLGSVASFKDGAGRMFEFGAQIGGAKPFRLLVLRSGDEFFAYVNRCAHFGVPLAAKEEQLILKPHQSFSCNVHYARYRWRDGYCEYGDCEGESLIPVSLSVVDETVRIA